MTRAPQLLIAACICVTLTSCVGSENPLSSPDEAVLDERLLGLWANARGKYHHIGKARKGFPEGMCEMVIVEGGEAGFTVLRFLGFTTKHENNTYLNLGWVKPTRDGGPAFPVKWSDDLIEFYIIAKYEIDGDFMRLAIFQEEAVKAAIKRGDLKKSTISSTVVADSGERVLEYLVANHDKVWSPMETLYRLKRPATH